MSNSLSLRLFLVILGGVILAAALTAALAQRDRARALGALHVKALVSHFTDVITLLARLPPEYRRRAAMGLPPTDWAIAFDAPQSAVQGRPVPQLAWMLSKRLGQAVRIEGASVDQTADCGDQRAPCAPPRRTARVAARFADGQRAELSFKRVRERPPRPEQQDFIAGVAIFVGVLAVAAWLSVRLALRPLQRMTEAVDAFGRDISQAPLDTSGPIEVRRAAEAFNRMQDRIRTHMRERTHMLAAITHDLKTPLTRMRLRVEHCSDERLRAKLHDDIVVMQSLIDDGLDLSRSLETSEAIERLDLTALLQSLCDDAAETGSNVHFREPMNTPRIQVYGQPNALTRVFSNLIDNAIKYGGYADVSLEQAAGVARVCIRDSGPGIPEERLGEVLRPFVRLEQSRSRDTGGTGLGLAIATNLLAAHQGRLTLRNLPDRKGLEACVELPLCEWARKLRRATRGGTA